MLFEEKVKMATTKTQEGKLSKLCVSTLTQRRGFSFHIGLTIWKSQVERAFLNTSLVREKQEGLPTGQASRPSSSSAGHSPSVPDRESGRWRNHSQPRGQRPREASHRASPSSLERAAVGQGWRRTAAKPSQGQGKGAAGPVAPSGPWHLTAVYPDVLNLYLQAYHSTIKYIPLHFSYLFGILSVSYIVLSSYRPTLSLLCCISLFPTGSPLQKSNKRDQSQPEIWN